MVNIYINTIFVIMIHFGYLLIAYLSLDTYIKCDYNFYTIFQQYCESEGAYLAEINTDKENDWIHKTLVVPHFTRNLGMAK